MQNETPVSAGRRTLLLLVTGILLLAFGWILTGETVEAKDAAKKAKKSATETERVAVVAGETITEADLEIQAKEQLEQLEIQRIQAEMQLRNQRYETLKAALDQLLEEKLLAKEAAARGVEPEALIESEVKAKIEPVTDEDVSAFYATLGARAQGQQVPPQEQISGQIRQHLEQQAQATARGAFLAELEEKYDVEVLLEAPKVEIAADPSRPAVGPEDAPVTLVEFSDFQCPFCSRIVPAIDQVKENYKDQVRIVFRQFPLRNIHPQAQKAAEASLCAHEQGEFWAMHDLMFQEQQKLEVSDLKEKAERLELDTEKFGQCLDSGKYADEVQDDLMAGVQAGVSGTPAVFINGRFLSGAQPYEALAQIIEEELERAGEG